MPAQATHGHGTRPLTATATHGHTRPHTHSMCTAQFHRPAHWAGSYSQRQGSSTYSPCALGDEKGCRPVRRWGGEASCTRSNPTTMRHRKRRATKAVATLDCRRCVRPTSTVPQFVHRWWSQTAWTFPRCGLSPQQPPQAGLRPTLHPARSRHTEDHNHFKTRQECMKVYMQHMVNEKTGPMTKPGPRGS